MNYDIGNSSLKGQTDFQRLLHVSCDEWEWQIQGDFFNWSRPKSVGDGKIPTKKVKVRVSHRENMKF